MQLTNEWYYFTAVIDPEVCRKIIDLAGDDFAEAKVDTKRGITEQERITGIKPKIGKDESIRISNVKWLTDQWLYDLVWPYMQSANEKSGWKFDIRGAESLQLTRYTPGGFYSWHRDGKSDHLSAYNNPANKFLHGHVRKLSMTLLLNNDFEGGEFEFSSYNKGEQSVNQPEFNKPGSIIFFPSFMEHRVAPVTRGVRYSLVCWMLGPPFK